MLRVAPVLAALAYLGTGHAFVLPATSASFAAHARLPTGNPRYAVRENVRPVLRASAQSEVSRRSALALIGLMPCSAIAKDFPVEEKADEVTARNPDDPYYKKLVDSKDASSERKRLQKGMANPGAERKQIAVPKALQKKGALKPPDVTFPLSAGDLEGYEQTESGVFYKVIKEGSGGQTPKKGQVVEIHYVGCVATTDEDGNYDLAEREGDPEIYPNLPQGILRDSPRFDSSFDRGRTMKVRFGRAQLAGGLEEALSDMTAGGAKMVFLTPELAYSCPPGKVCFPDIEADERLAFYVELVSVGVKGEGGG